MDIQEPPRGAGQAHRASRRDVIEFAILMALLVSALAFIAWNRTAYRENFLKEFSEEPSTIQVPTP